MAQKPNIVLLITDQQRRAAPLARRARLAAQLMPNEAELARTGLSFTNGFCNTAMCSPSRATLFTGRYPAEHGVDADADPGRPAPGPAPRARTCCGRWPSCSAAARLRAGGC